MRDLMESHHTFGRAMLADLTRRDAPVVSVPSRFVQIRHPLYGNWWKLDQVTGRVVECSSGGPFDFVEVPTFPTTTAKASESPVDGNSGGLGTITHAGAGDGRVRAPQPGFPTPFDHAFAAISAVYDSALAIVRAAPPMPLESPDPWCEDNVAYSRRIGVPFPGNSTDCLDPDGLDAVVREYGLPRACLVRVLGRED